ncbi:MAG: nuclear transport factor 2 family protein [Gracilimonas sp.]|uniref:nuclear transport factor 2 family protein n=1 Tax=Gracilimonas TaxID=649462 RepID=UPI001B0C6F72|nr:nuclear transport factor 2 family protein [Gracilimonas sp.]MBO6585575.1 nuclear transport factor 2 family protein [Gracilimonas sp.]MBO6616572.1 nuclear transport factor 2 family protein [Gracilimonas sp.]
MESLIKIVTVLVFLSGTAIAQTNQKETNVLKALENFKTAIVENDSEAASNVMADDVLILEGSGMETKEEYLSHHFHSDGKFLKAMDREILTQKISIEGNTAWVSTVSSMKGTYSEREIDLTSLELAVLKKAGSDWKITAIHWSSR